MTAFSATMFSQVNYWAVLVGGLLTFFLGGLWYSPVLFEEVWMNSHGYSRLQLEQVQSSLGPLGFGGAFAAYLLMVMVLASLAAMLGVNGIGGGVLLGLLLWLGFVATTGFTVNLFSVQPLSAWLIDAGFQLVALLLSGGIIGLWR